MGRVSIVCVSCYENSVHMITSNQPLRLEGKCTGCVTGKYNWTVIRDDGDILEIDEGNTATGGTEPNLSIHAYVLASNHSYTFRLSVSSLFFPIGMAQLELPYNIPPSGGKCQLHNNHVVALKEQIHIDCSGWVDSDENSALIYSVVAHDSRNSMFSAESSYPLYRGPMSTGSYYVSPSAPDYAIVTITVMVIDRLGASTLALMEYVGLYITNQIW